MTRYVSKEEMVEVIKLVKTSTMLTLEAETEIKVPKSNPYHGATKRNTINGQIGFYYGNAVNNELGREDKAMDFRPQMAKWQKPTDSRNLVTNAEGTKLYVYIRVLSSGTPQYFMQGDEVSRDTIAPYLPEHKVAHTQENLDKEVVVRTFSLENILSIKMLKDEYRLVEHLTEQEKTAVEQEQEAAWQAHELHELLT
jgi:hypothetical protein